MKFLLVEILIWLIAASILGLVVGWLFKGLLAGRRLDRVNADWDGQYNALKASSDKEILEMEESVTSTETENSTLQSKVSSLSAMVKSMETALMKANAENKSLSSTVSSQQLTINEIRIESENLIKQQSAMQMKLNTLEKSKEQEFESLNQQLGEHADKSPVESEPASSRGDGQNSADSAFSSGVAPVLNTPGETDASDIDQKIANLNQQRDRLNREREELFNQEQHFAAQLPSGDDTEAYLDQTIRIDEDLTSTIQSDTSELHRAAAAPTDADSLTITRDDQKVSAAQSSTHPDSEKPKSLWDKFKSSVNRPTDKPKLHD